MLLYFKKMYEKRMYHFILYIVLILVLWNVSLGEESVSDETKEQSKLLKDNLEEDKTQNQADDASAHDEVVRGKLTSFDKFKKLFMEHRAIQLNAIKSLQGFGDYSQRYKLVEIMLQQLFSIINQARVNLTEWGHLPGDPFPDNETMQESVAKVFENTAMFGDMVLRLPDIVHELYDKKREWQMTLAWSVGFCNESLIFEGSSGTLLNLMAQEVNLIPKRPDYINPYTASAQQAAEQQKATEKQSKREKTKKKKKMQRGPRLSSPRTEL